MTFKSLLFFSVGALMPLASVASTPLEVTNWNRGAIATSTSNESSEHFNDFGLSTWGENWSLYATSVLAEGAISDESRKVSVGDDEYLLSDYNFHHALQVSPWNEDGSTVRFGEVYASKLHVLVVNAGATGNIKIHPVFSDNTTGADATVKLPSWDAGEGENYIEVGRRAFNHDDYEDNYIPTEKNLRVFSVAVDCDASKPVVGININAYNEDSYNNPRVTVLAVNADKAADFPTPSISVTEKIEVAKDETANLVLTYDLNGAERQPVLTAKAESLSARVSIGEGVEDAEAKTFTFPVKALAVGDAGEITVTFTHANKSVTATVPVKVTGTPGTYDLSNCVAVSNWPSDVIAEAHPVENYANTSLDNSGWVLYNDNLKIEGALVDNDGVVTAASGTVFKIADVNGNNALKVTPGEAKTLEFAGPVSVGTLHLLVISSNGSATFSATPVYTDASEATAKEDCTAADWYSDNADGNEAVYGVGRVAYSNRYDSGFDSRLKFRLYEVEIPCDKSKQIKGLSLKNSDWEGGVPTVLAVSKSDSTTSINDLTADKAGRTIEGYYNLHGQKVNDPVSGLYIVKYSDGTAAKIIK